MGVGGTTADVVGRLLRGLAGLREGSLSDTDGAGSIGSFPLPSFLDLELLLVDVGRAGDFMTLFL